MSSKVTITANQDTLLKKKPVQSSELADDEVVVVDEGKEYVLVWRDVSSDGHTKVSLDYDGGNWYIFDAHWDGLTPVEPEKNGITPKKLDTPYFSQRDNYRDASRTCFSSSCAMLLETMKPGTLPGTRGDDKYIQTVFSIGDTTEAWVQQKALKEYDLNATYVQNGTLATLRSQIDKGIPVPIGILHHGPGYAPSGGGHWICVYGYFCDGFWVHDPWGELNHKTGQYISTDGEALRYSNELIKARWTVSSPNDGWAMLG